MLIYTVIFSVFTRVPTGDIRYPIFSYSALLPWLFFSTSVTTAANGMVSHTQLITKVYFPREIIPLTYVAAAFFDLLVATVPFAGLMLYYGIALTSRALWALPILLLAAVFTMGLCLLLSAIQIKFRDIGIALPLLLQIWMFASPVVYSLDTVTHALDGPMLALYLSNPMAGIVENFRRVVVSGASPDFGSLAPALVVSALLLPAGFMYFKNREATMADII
jgi:lipopolysaccharide transport system permease protein